MNTLPSVQKLTQAANGNIQAFQSFADIVLNASERLVALNIEAARTLCSTATANAAPLTASNDMRDQIAARMGTQGKMFEQAAEYFRSFNDLCAKTQSEVAELNTQRLNEVSGSVHELLDSVAKAGPTGAADIVAAMKAAMNNASAAYENMIKTTRDVTESNLAAASNALQPMVTAAVSAKQTRKAA